MFVFLLFYFLLPSTILSSATFVINPGCINEPRCTQFDQPAIFYANQTVNNNIVHVIYSSFDELTISVLETSKDHGPIIDYSQFFAKNYSGAIQFPEKIPPINAFSFVIRRLIEFNDLNDTGRMNEYDNKNSTNSYPLNDAKTNNKTFPTSTTDQPTFEIPIPTINGTLRIDVVYPGQVMRDSKFPKLQVQSKSVFLNIALQANGFNWTNTRYALELFVMSFDRDGFKSISSRSIDDHFTPGIFNVWQLKTIGDYYLGSMLWKPVVYLSEDRSIEENTLMRVYSLNNNITLNTDDRGLFTALYPQAYVSAFNVSFGQSGDGFFAKNNYTFIQFAAGLDDLEPDSTKVFVTVALIISLALPGLVGLIALIVVLRRRFSPSIKSGYDTV